MPRLAHDLRYGVRMLAKTPAATLTVLLALSLGIGLPTLLFSVINGAMLASLPFDGGERVVRLYRADEAVVTDAEYAAWAARQRSFERLGVVTMGTVTLAVEGRLGEPVAGASMTPSVLPLLAAAPAVGRRFTDADAAPGAPAVLLVSDAVWRERLGADPKVIGRVLRVNGRPAEVIGVMPAGFGFPWKHDVWAPLTLDPLRAQEHSAEPDTRWVVGRLRTGVSPSAAARELTTLSRELEAERGAAGAPAQVRVVNYTNLFNQRGQSIVMGALLLGVAFLVLLVACANVANVLLARTVARRREVAIRVAVGASAGRIAAQLWAEVALLAAAGAASGAVIATVGARAVEGALPRAAMPFWVHFDTEPAVLGFVVGVGVLAALLSGVTPAVQASRSNPHALLQDGSRGGSSFHLGRVMRRLIGVEMALSFVLLVMAGLFIRSAVNLGAADFPFAPEDVYTARVAVPDPVGPAAAAPTRVPDALRRALEALPQVDGVALATAVPGVGSSAVGRLEVAGTAAVDAANRPPVRSIVVTPGFFALFRATIVAGRDLDDRDREGAVRVAVVNAAFAKRYLPDGAVHRRIRLAGEGNDAWLTIVGVTSDLMAGGRDAETEEAVYLPLAQHPRTALTILARPAAAGYAALPGAIREAVAGVAPDAALFDVQRLEAAIARDVAQYTWASALFVVSGAMALFLASIGLYGVMAFWVAQRTREIGVRMALGGRQRDVVRVVLAQGMSQTAVGLGAGVLLAIPAARLVSAALYGVTPYDAVVFGAVAAILLSAAWLGCWLPARRATRVDPLRALAAE